MVKIKKQFLLSYYQTLLDYFGPQDWWPGDTPLEIMIGAILTQNTNWGNVERAIDNLKSAKLLDPKKIVVSSKQKVEKLIRPSGYFRAKAKKLKIFCKWLLERGGVAKLKKLPVAELRPQLLDVWGIGPETADSILCYGLEKLSFVVDAYTVRIFNRLGIIKTTDYHEVKDIFESSLPKSLKIYNEYHALIVALGKDVCKPKPKCELCPLISKCKTQNNLKFLLLNSDK